MSSLLEQAIIDAKLLKETAKKNAEAELLEKYKEKIRKNVDLLLEQEEDLAAGGDLGLDSAEMSSPMPTLEPDIGDTAKPTEDVKKIIDKIPPAYLGQDNLQEVEINLDSIIEKIDSLEKELNVKIPDMQTSPEEVHAHSNPVRAPAVAELAEAVEEDEEEETIEEELIIDLENVSPGGINANEIELKKQYNVSKALEAQNEDLNEQLDAKARELDEMEQKLQNALSRLQETRSKLKKSAELNVTLKESFQLITKKINEVNVLNSRLLYTNKILGNSSLNERQKKQIAESISNASTVEEAKTIYETLQRSADAVVEKRTAPQSLTEALNRTAPAFLPRVSNTIDPVKDRWQRIAGISSKK